MDRDRRQCERIYSLAAQGSATDPSAAAAAAAAAAAVGVLSVLLLWFEVLFHSGLECCSFYTAVFFFSLLVHAAKSNEAVAGLYNTSIPFLNIHLNICGILVLSDRMEVGMSFVVWNGLAMK